MVHVSEIGLLGVVDEEVDSEELVDSGCTASGQWPNELMFSAGCSLPLNHELRSTVVDPSQLFNQVMVTPLVTKVTVAPTCRFEMDDTDDKTSSELMV